MIQNAPLMVGMKKITSDSSEEITACRIRIRKSWLRYAAVI